MILSTADFGDGEGGCMAGDAGVKDCFFGEGSVVVESTSVASGLF